MFSPVASPQSKRTVKFKIFLRKLCCRSTRIMKTRKKPGAIKSCGYNLFRCNFVLIQGRLFSDCTASTPPPPLITPTSYENHISDHYHPRSIWKLRTFLEHGDIALDDITGRPRLLNQSEILRGCLPSLSGRVTRKAPR